MNKSFLLIGTILTAISCAKAQQFSIPTVPHGMRGQPPHNHYNQIVDAFGQYAKIDWPGKLHSAAEFTQRLEAENAEIHNHPAPPSYNTFGGWKNGPQLPRKKYFYTTRYRDKWALVDPQGHLFFSLGMDSVRPNEPTITTNREEMFSWLPASDDALNKFRGAYNKVIYGPIKSGETYDFYQANLQRKYGADYLNRWKEQVPARLRSWGFNTFGNWNYLFYANGKMPYTVALSVGGDHARLSAGLDYWGKMHDPFDPQFAADVQKMVDGIPANVIDDPYCIGYFVDNELSWGAPGGLANLHYGLAYSALAQDAASSAAKSTFIAQLQHKYHTIAQLNKAWNTQFKNWAHFEKPYTAPSNANAQMQADCSAFLNAHAEKYFSVINHALKKVDPHHLYLGCRFAIPWRTPEAVNASAKYCDVVSFNAYVRDISPALDFTKDLQKPCIIGEFHFGALDRGMFHPGLVKADSQQQRAAMFEHYLQSVLQSPAFVGCHWFKWSDEPLTGRPMDGENYNIGFVDVTDTPYPEMVNASRKMANKLYTMRYSEE